MLRDRDPSEYSEVYGQKRKSNEDNDDDDDDDDRPRNRPADSIPRGDENKNSRMNLKSNEYSIVRGKKEDVGNQNNSPLESSMSSSFPSHHPQHHVRSVSSQTTKDDNDLNLNTNQDNEDDDGDENTTEYYILFGQKEDIGQRPISSSVLPQQQNSSTEPSPPNKNTNTDHNTEYFIRYGQKEDIRRRPQPTVSSSSSSSTQPKQHANRRYDDG
jgi:hypothetical protein